MTNFPVPLILLATFVPKVRLSDSTYLIDRHPHTNRSVSIVCLYYYLKFVPESPAPVNFSVNENAGHCCVLLFCKSEI